MLFPSSLPKFIANTLRILLGALLKAEEEGSCRKTHLLFTAQHFFFFLGVRFWPEVAATTTDTDPRQRKMAIKNHKLAREKRSLYILSDMNSRPTNHHVTINCSCVCAARSSHNKSKSRTGNCARIGSKLDLPTFHDRAAAGRERGERERERKRELFLFCPT